MHISYVYISKRKPGNNLTAAGAEDIARAFLAQPEAQILMITIIMMIIIIIMNNYNGNNRILK